MDSEIVATDTSVPQVNSVVSYASSNVVVTEQFTEENTIISDTSIEPIEVEPLFTMILDDDDIADDDVVGEGSSTNIDRIFECPDHLKPTIGKVFANFQAAIDFYEEYAKASGFVSRLGGDKRVKGVITHKRCFCNKQGESNATGTKQKRQQTRTGCKAMISFKRRPNDEYEIHRFVEGHNRMPLTPVTMEHMKQSRELSIVHKKMIIDNSKVNEGPTKTFRMFKEYVRGYNNIGASLEDFKNFGRDVKEFLSQADAQMLIEHFMRKKSMCPSFYFDFDIDDTGRLSQIFWADPISIKNYLLFGDMLSFDTTFKKNTYKMIFAPFTGVDHHKRCVTFGAGLLVDESAESFSWLFERFLDAMGGRYPACIITDQDLGIKGGIKKVFGKKTKRRYCMWHILKKLSDKVPSAILKDTNFLKDLSAIVWGEDVEPAEFEEKWSKIMESYGLLDNEWLKDKFDIRKKWVPAYFRDLFLGGLMRTTSRSESENNFFSKFTNPNLTLVEFWMRYETAMDAQRWTQARLIATSKYSFPKLSTPLALEKHASETYTQKIFYEFQEELKEACYTCDVEGIRDDPNSGIEFISIVDHLRNHKVYVVTFMSDEEKLECTCKKFERHGILCRHALLVLKGRRHEKIPSQYVAARWTKLATCRPIFDNNDQLLKDCKTVDVQKNKIGELWSELFTCVSLVEHNEPYTDELLDMLRGFKEKILEADINVDGKKKDKNAEIGMLLGTTIPDEIVVLPPKQCKNKGSGKRLISQRDKAVKESNKPKRRCKACGEMANHDSRNCDKK